MCKQTTTILKSEEWTTREKWTPKISVFSAGGDCLRDWRVRPFTSVTMATIVNKCTTKCKEGLFEIIFGGQAHSISRAWASFCFLEVRPERGVFRLHFAWSDRAHRWIESWSARCPEGSGAGFAVVAEKVTDWILSQDRLSDVPSSTR